jgi:hypothetical protein
MTLKEYLGNLQKDGIGPEELEATVRTVRDDEPLMTTLVISALLDHSNPIRCLSMTLALGICLGKAYAETQGLEEMMKAGEQKS